MFIAWQITGVIALFCYWWKESFVMTYFPCRAWWFWMYSLMTLPWSATIWLAIAYSHISYRNASVRSLQGSPRQRSKAHGEYEEHIVRLTDQLDDARKKWETLFPPHFRETEIRRLDTLVPRLRQRTDELATELEHAQQEYFAARAQLDTLNSQSDLGDNTEIKTWKETWTKELDVILQNPHVRAVALSLLNERSEYIFHVFTDTFQSSTGGVGPFRIEINMYRQSFGAYTGHEQAMRNSTGLGYGESTFCFGNVLGTIEGLIRNYQISEAVAVMINSFQTNS